MCHCTLQEVICMPKVCTSQNATQKAWLLATSHSFHSKPFLKAPTASSGTAGINSSTAPPICSSTWIIINKIRSPQLSNSDSSAILSSLKIIQHWLKKARTSATWIVIMYFLYFLAFFKIKTTYFFVQLRAISRRWVSGKQRQTWIRLQHKQAKILPQGQKKEDCVRKADQLTNAPIERSYHSWSYTQSHNRN